MGQKVNPIGFRLSLTKRWSSRWYSDREYAKFLEEDIGLKKFIEAKYEQAGISSVEIERTDRNIKINVHTSRPGIVIGRKGESIEELKQQLKAKSGMTVDVNVHEVKQPEIDASLMAAGIAAQLKRRIAFRRAIRRTLSTAMRMNIKGCKIMVSGRLNGAEMSRREWVREGQLPLHTLRAAIDYARASAMTTYGVVGVQVWVYKGEQRQRPASRPRRRQN